MRWIVEQLNEQKTGMHHVYDNLVLDKERAAEFYLMHRDLPKKIGFLFNVSKEKSNCNSE